MAEEAQVPVATRPPRPAGPVAPRKRKPRPPAQFKPRCRAFLIDLFAGWMAFNYGLVLLSVPFAVFAAPEVAGMAGIFSGFMAWFCYHWLTIAHSGQTAGKEMLGVKVVRLDGRPIGRYHAAGRVLAGMLSWLTLGVGFLVPLFRADKRALHDLVARTRVVEFTQRSIPSRPVAGGSSIGRTGV